MIRVVFFAGLREALGDSVEVAHDESIKTVEDLIARLIELNGDGWAEELNASHVLIAVNQEMTTRLALVADSDEVAFFPPVTGG
ncbi:MAG: MoaD/ThiS family protein [Neptunomonas phycophila]|uniref:MoaD/ThiS family protein n=1 Tax=Neptunomonas phycophila TaxID=1572645 RepID=UPI003B8BA6A5